MTMFHKFVTFHNQTASMLLQECMGAEHGLTEIDCVVSVCLTSAPSSQSRSYSTHCGLMHSQPQHLEHAWINTFIFENKLCHTGLMFFSTSVSFLRKSLF